MYMYVYTSIYIYMYLHEMRKIVFSILVLIFYPIRDIMILLYPPPRKQHEKSVSNKKKICFRYELLCSQEIQNVLR